MKDKKHEGRKVLKQTGAARKKVDRFARAENLNKAKRAQDKLNAKDVRAHVRREENDRSERALAAHGKPGQIGKPFMPGEDPRRHKLGRVSLDRAAFSAKVSNYLCNGTGSPKDLARILWKYALKGEAWAVSELLDRICGKVAQAVQLEEPVRKFIIVYADEALEPAGTDPRAERELSLSRKIEGQDGR
jgi:hypothetical protein